MSLFFVFFPVTLFDSFDVLINNINKSVWILPKGQCFFFSTTTFQEATIWSVQPKCWSSLVSSVSSSSTDSLFTDRLAWLCTSVLLQDRSSPVSTRTEEALEDEAEASIAEVLLVSVRLLFTVLKTQVAEGGLKRNMVFYNMQIQS